MITKIKVEATKFMVVGATYFVLTFCVFTVMLKIFELNYVLSLISSWIVGMIYSYILNYVWVFKPEDKFQFRDRFVRYFFASGVSIALNIVALSSIVESTGAAPFYVQTALIPFIVIFNYSTAKFWSLASSR